MHASLISNVPIYRAFSQISFSQIWFNVWSWCAFNLNGESWFIWFDNVAEINYSLKLTRISWREFFICTRFLQVFKEIKNDRREIQYGSIKLTITVNNYYWLDIFLRKLSPFKSGLCIEMLYKVFKHVSILLSRVILPIYIISDK